MGISDLVGQIEGTNGQPNGMVAAVCKAVADAGGVGAVVSKLEQSGLGSQASSWVGKGKNQPADPKRIGKGLGKANVQRVAKHAGVSETEATRGISSILPEVIDSLTPAGRVPPDGGAGALSQLISRLS